VAEVDVELVEIFRRRNDVVVGLVEVVVVVLTSVLLNDFSPIQTKRKNKLDRSSREVSLYR
jgi:hypothetical protein